MNTSTVPEIKKSLNMKAKGLFTLFSLAVLLTSNVFAQPVWTSGPTFTPHPITVDVTFTLDQNSKVYYVAYPTPTVAIYTSAFLKALAISGGPQICDHGTFIYSAPGPATLTIYNFPASSQVTIFLVAESNPGGVLQAFPIKTFVTTLACPKIDVLTGFSQPITCVNKTATATFNVVIVDPNPDNNGIYKGTQWTIDWGDGTTAAYISVADDDLPPIALRTHTFSTITSCNYVFSNGIKNPCGETRAVQYIAVVHGRDIPSDGDGVLSVVNQADGSSTINVCAGTQSIITLRDNSTWNCQNPILPGGLTPVPNNSTRNIEWMYGQDPVGAITNTITGTVTIATLGNAPASSGRIIPSPYGSTSPSQAITIPATCQAGQYFRVYLMNWNKCNPTDPEYVSTFININVIAAPPAPTVPNSIICFGGDRTLTVTSTPVGTITWYSDAGLTTIVATGTTYIPTNPAVGTYNYWVTDQSTSGLMCISPATMVTLTILPIIGNNSVATAQTICFNTPPTGLTGSLPTGGNNVYSYQWQNSADNVTFNNIGGATSQNYSPPALLATTYYRRIVTSGPCSDISPSIQITVNPAPTANAGANISRCDGTPLAAIAMTGATAGGTYSASTWSGGAGLGNWAQNANPALATFTPTVTSGSFVATLTVTGSGGCLGNNPTSTRTITWGQTPTANADGNISRCDGTPLNPIAMTGATEGGTYSGNAWSGGVGSGNWTQNANPALATFTPTVTSGSFTATLTVTGGGACSGTNPTSIRTISWGQTPTANAGGAISRCDGTPLAAIAMTGASAGGSYSAVTWSGGAGSGNWTQNANPALATFTPTVTSGSFTATLTVTGANGCSGTNPTSTRTITWGQTPTAAAGGNISRCDATPLNPITMTGATAGGTFSSATWSGGAGSGNWTQNADPALATFTPTISFNSFIATLTVTGSGSCTGTNPTSTRTISWAQSPTVNAGANISRCDGTPLNPIAMTGATASGTYSAASMTWSGGGGLGTWIQNNNPALATFTPTVSTGSFTATLTVSGAGACVGSNPTSTRTISWGQTPSANAGLALSRCDATPLAAIVMTGATAGGSYSAVTWSGGAGQGNWTQNGNPALATFTPTVNVGSFTATLTVTGTNGCSGTNPTSTRTIDWGFLPTVNAGVDQTICAGSTVTLAGTIGGGAASATWTGGTGTFNPNNTTLNAIYTPSAAEVTAGTLTLTLTTNDPAGPCTAVNDAMVITINQAATVNAGLDQSICALSSATLAGSFGGSATSATWSGGTGTYVPNNTTMNAVYTPSAAERLAGTVTLTLTTNDPAGPCPAVSDNVIITIGAALTGATLTGSGDACFGAASTLKSVITGGAPPYTLTITGFAGSPVAGYTSGSNIPLTPPALAVGAHTYTLASVTDACTNSIAPGINYTITIFAIPDASTTVNNTPSICYNGTTDIVFHSNVANSDFIYTVSNAPAVTWVAGKTPVAGTQVNGENISLAQNLAHTSTFPTTVTYTITPRGPGATACLGTPITRTVVVNPLPILTSTLTPPAFCSGTAFSYTPTSATAGTTFNWSRATVAGITPVGPTSGTNNPNETLTNTTANPIVVTYAYTLAANGCSNVQNVTVTVNPSPTLSSTLTPPAICSNTAFSYTPTSATAGTTFNWSRAIVAGITPVGPTSGTNNPNETLVNTTANAIVVTYAYTLAANGCSNVQNVTVTVNPTPTLSSSLTPPAFCSSTAFSYTPTSATAGTTFNWTRATVAGITPVGPTSGTNNPNETLVNTTANPIVVTYTYTLAANGCSNVQNVTVTVNPSPTLSSTLTPPAICSNTAFSYTPTSATAGTTFNWSRATVAGITPVGPTSGTNNPNETLVNTTANPIVVTYAYTLAANGCSNVQNVTVTVNPKPTLSSTLTPPAICSNTAFSYTPTSATAGTTFNWSRATVAGITPVGPTSGTNNPNETLVNTTANPIVVTYAYTLAANGCSNVQNVTVTVNPSPTLSSTLTPPAICSNTAFSYTPTSATAGTTFNWTRATVAGITPVGPTSGVNNPNETLVNTTANPIVVTYAYTLAANGCSNVQNVTVTINPSPTLSSTLTPPAICSNTAFSYTPTSATAGTTFNWSRATVAGITPVGPTSGTNNPNETLVNTTANPIVVTYAYTLAANGCSNVQNVTVTVNPKPTLTSTLTPPAICSNTAFSYTPTSATAGTTFNWSRATVAGITPVGPTSGTNNPNETLVNTTANPIVVTYAYTLTANGCSNVQNVTVTVNPSPALSSTLTPADVCSNSLFSYNPTSATAGTTFNWTRALVAGITPAGPTSGTNNPNETLRNITSAPIAVTYQYTLAANGCSNVQNVVVNIKPEPVITAGQNPTICSGIPMNYQVLMNNFTNPADNVTFTWPAPVLNPISPNFTGGSARAVGSSANITDTYLNTTGALATATYTITPLKNGCSGTAVQVVITVGAQPVLNPGLNGFACSKVATGLTLSVAGGSVPATYYNVASITVAVGLTADPGNVAIPNATAPANYLAGDKFTNTTGVNKTVTYHIQPILAPDCYGAFVDVVITIRPQPVILPGQTKTVCSEVAIGKEILLVPANTPAGTLFNWPLPVMSDLSVQGTAGVNVVADPSGTIHINNALNNFSAAPITATYTVTPTSSFGCVGTATPVIITIKPEPTPSVISGPDKICVNEKNIVYTVNPVAGSNFYWTVDPGIGTKTFDFNTNAILVDAAAIAGSGNITVYEVNSFLCTGGTSTLAVQVYATPAPENIVGSPGVCAYSTETYSVGSRVGSVYSWTIPVGASIIGDPTANSITVIFATTGGTILCRETNAAGCVTNHNPLAVTVNPLPVPTLTGGASACFNSTGNVYTTEAGMFNYIWTVSAGGTVTAGGTAASNTITITWNTAGPQTVSVNYSNGNGCTAPSVTVKNVMVNPLGQVNAQANQVICNGSFTIPVTFSTINPGGTTTYTWTNDLTSIGLAASGSGNIASFTAINATTAPVMATITVTPHYSDGVVTCDGPSKTFTITVNPSGQVTAPANQVICNGFMTAAVNFTTNNTVGTTTYTWTNSDPTIGLAASGSGNIAAFAAVNAGTSPVTASIIVTPHFTNAGVTCDGPAQTFTIKVNPTAQVNDPADQVVCNGSPITAVNFGTINSGGAATYTWVNDTPGIGLAAGGTGNITAFNAINAGTAPVTATITVTPHFTNAGVTCDGPVQTFTIIVNPSGQVNAPASQVLCNGSSTTAVTFGTTNTGGATTYSWTNNATSIGLAATGTGNIGVFTAVNTGTAPVVATIIVTPHFTNAGVTCDGPVQTFTITVNPTGQVNKPANQTVCNGSNTAAVTFTTTNSGGATTYDWINDTPAIGLAAAGSGNIASFSGVNAGTAPVTATITVTPHFTNAGLTCDGPVQNFTITVNPTGQVNDPADQVVCNGSSTATVIFGTTNTGGTTTYTWTNDLASIGLAAAGSGDIPFFTAQNLTTAPVMATITVTPHFTNNSVSCTGPVQTFTIIVNPTAKVNDPADQVVCNGSPVTAVTFGTTNTGGVMTYNWTNSDPSIGLAASGTGNIASFNAVNAGTSPVVATVTVTPGFTNAGVTCTGPVQTFTITVNPTGEVNKPADQAVCNGSPVTAINFVTTNTGGTTTYSWTNSAPGIGLAAAGAGNIASFNGVNAGTAPVTATITVTPHFTNAGVTCDGPVQTFTITVNPTAQVNNPGNQVLCNGSPTAAITFTTTNTGGTTIYNWTNSAPGINLAASGTGDIPSFTASNITTSPVVATITVTPQYTNGSVTCSGPVKIFTITVNPAGQVNDPADQVVCNGAPTAAVNFTTNNLVGTTTYSWANDTPAIGLAATGAGNIASFNAINAGTSPVTATITVTPHFTNAGVTCDGPVQTFTITVNPTGQVNDPADQVLCNGAFTTPVAFATVNTGGTTTYTWVNDLPSIGLGASGSGNIPAFTAINGSGAPVVATITVTPHFANGSVTCNGPVQTFTITVNPTGQVNDPADQVVCNGALTTAVTFGTTNTGGATTYSWTNNTISIGLAAGGAGNIAAFAAVNATTLPVTATITVTPHYTNAGVTCDGPVQTFTITVNPTGQVNDPADLVVCNSSTVPAVTFTTGNTGGVTTYSWVNNTPSIGLAASGNGNIGSFAAVNAGTAPVIATVTVTPHFTNSGVTCDGPVQTFSITVNPTANVNDPADQVVCNGSPVAAVTFGTTNTGGTMTYDWTNNATSIGLAASGTGNIASFNAVNTGSSPVIATITVTPSFTNGSVTCTGPSQNFTITVNPTGQVNDPADKVVCNGSPTGAINFTTANTGGVTTYSWVNDKPAIGLAAAGAGNIVSFNAINAGTAPVTATLTVTPHFTNAGVTCDGPVQTFTITVNPSGQVNLPANQVVCNGSSTAAVTFATVSTGGVTTYSWTNNTTSIGLAAGGTGDLPSFTASNISTAPVVATITVTPHFTNGSVTCDGPVQTFTITVNPTGQVNKPANQTVCNGSNTAAVTFTTANSGGATTYDWINDTPAIGLAAAGSGNIASFSGVNAGTAPVTATITVTPHFTNAGVTCDGPVQNFTITINPTGQVNDPADQVVCNGSSTATVIFGTINTGGTTTYTWTNDLASIGLAAAGSGDIPFFTAQNLTTAPVMATITVTPHFTNNSVTCDGPVQTFTIIVNPTAKVNDPADQVVCNGSPVTAVTFGTTNTGGVMTYDWTNNATSIGLAATGTGNIASFNAVNAGTSPVVATVTVTPGFTNAGVTCTGTIQTFTITVNPTGEVNDPADQVVCNGSPVTAVNFFTSNTGGTTTYSWTNSAPGIGLAAAGTGNIASFNAVNATTAPVTATITITPHFTNAGVTCDGPVQTFTITVNPTAQVNNPGNQVLCNGSPTAAVTFTTVNTVGTTTYTWTNNATSIGLAASGTGDIGVFATVNNGTSPVVATIIVTPHFTNAGVTCSGPVQTFTITVNPTAQVNDPADQVVCNGAPIAAVTFTTTHTGGATTYSWVNDTPAIGLAAIGAGNIASFNAVNAGTAPVTATITVTPHFTNAGLTCDGPVQTFTITVNPTAQVNDPADQVVCNGSTTAGVNFTTVSTGGTTTCTWTNDLISIGLAASGSGDIPFFTAQNATTAPVIATITVTPHFTNGSVSCTGPVQTFTITVNPTAKVNDPADQVVCNGLPVTAVTFGTTNTGGTMTYDWTNNTISIGLAASGTGNIASFNAVNAGTSPVVATITVTPSFTNAGVTCSGTVQTFTITVNPTAQVNDPLDQEVCNGSPVSAVNFTTFNSGGATTYTWVNSTPSIGLAASGSGNIASFAAVNAGTAPVIATITVTPHFTNAGVICDGPVQTFTITVNPTANVNDPTDQVVCNGLPVAAVTFGTTNTGGTMIYNWTNNATSIGLAGSGTGNIASFNAINTGGSPVVAMITVTPNFTNGSVTCSGPVQTFTITVNPTGQVNKPANQVVCNGSPVAPVNFVTTNSGGATTYSWINDTPAIGLPGAGAGNIALFNAVNAGAAPVTATITVTPHFTNAGVTCDGPVQTFTITVNPTPNVSTVSPTSICTGTSTNIVLTSNVAGANFSWTIGAITGGITGANASSGSTIVQTLFNPGLAAGTVEYIVTPTANSCSGIPVSIIVTVNPLTGPTTFTTGATEVCQDAPDETYTATAVNSTSIVYSVAPVAAGIINAVTGVMNWDAAFSGTATITATSTGLCGTTFANLSVRVKALPAITSSPADKTICEYAMVSFSVTATGSDLTYQWYVDQHDGNGFVALGDTAAYFGSATPTLNLFGTVRRMNGYTYQAQVSGCSIVQTSANAILTVNTVPEILNQPKDSTICQGAGATFNVNAQGTGLTYQWRVKKGAAPWANVLPDANFSGETTPTLTIVNAPGTFNNYLFQVKITGTCGFPASSNFVVLRVNVPPTVTTNPANKAVCENGGPVTFLAYGSGLIDSLRWQVKIGAAPWTDIYDNSVYSGTTSQQLNLTDIPVGFNGNQYRLALIAYCTTTYTNPATLTVNANPVVDFSAVNPINACGGVPMVINGNPTGGSGTYTQHTWTGDVGPLNNYFIQSPTFRSQIAGTFNLNYQVKDSKGCTANDSLEVIVDAPDATFATDVSIGCTPLTVNFTKDMTGIAKFWWDFGDASPKDSVNANPTHIFTNVTPSSIEYHDVVLKVRSAGGCYATFTTTVTVYPQIDATFTANKIVVCSGNAIIFTAVSGASKYFWDYGDGANGYASNVATHLYTNLTTAPVPYTVTLTTTSFYNCTNSQTMTITVMPVPLPGFTANPVSQVYNAGGNPVTFTNTTSAGTWTWLWKFGDGGTSVAQDPVHNYTGIGSYDIWLTASNTDCADSIKHSITITPVPPVANFDSVPSACAPLNVNFNNTSLNANIPGTKFLWDFGDGSTSTAKSPSYTYFTPGTYRITLTVTGPYGDQSVKSQVVDAYISPKANFSLAPTNVYVNDEKVRYFNLTQYGDYYVWDFGDGDTSHVEQPFHKYMKEGVYDVTLHAYSSNGCMDSYTMSPGVTVIPPGVLRFSTVFTPNRTGPIDRTTLPTGGPEIDQFFFPPIRETVLDYKLEIFNRWGTLIFESHDINVPWNGYYKGKLCKQGVYVWFVEGKYANGKPFKKTGDVTLLQ